MCTALTLQTTNHEHFFGRNMDIEVNFGQSVLIIPRNFPYTNVASEEVTPFPYACIGMGTLIDGHPMLADGMNEKGLACAGLNFSGYVEYEDHFIQGDYNIPPFDIIAWILGNFTNVIEVKQALQHVNIIKKQFNDYTPLPTLHWMVTDSTGESIVIEKTKHGLFVWDNYVGVLTNAPTFDWHVTNLNQYIHLQSQQPQSTIWSEQPLTPLGQGLGAVGLPGDFSPTSRFVRIGFLRAHMPTPTKDTVVSEFFHMLNNVAMVRGAVVTQNGHYDVTQYTCCMHQEKGIYYYTTYNNPSVRAIHLHKENLNATDIKLFPYEDTFIINEQN